jgi:hypothetical protein
MLPNSVFDRALPTGTPLRLAHREKDEKLAVFLLPGMSGDAGELAPLLSAIGAPLHFLPIHYPHWSSLRGDANDLDRLVADCVSQIESYGPTVTIHLVDYSFGGLIAWAVTFPRMLNLIDHNIQSRFHLLPLKDCVSRIAASKERLQYPAALVRGSGWPLGEDADLGWTRHLVKVRVVTISGNHNNVFKSNRSGHIISHLIAMKLEGDRVLMEHN